MRSIFGSRDFQFQTEDVIGNGLVHDCPFMFMVNALGEENSATAFIQSIIGQELNFLIPALKQAEDLKKMNVDIERSCARILDTVQEKSKENPKLASKKPVNFSLVIMLPCFDKTKKLIGLGLGKSMIVLERNKCFHTLKPAVLLENGEVRSLPCGSKDHATDAEMELCQYSVVTPLNPQDDVHLISPDCYQFLKLEEKPSKNKERLISLAGEQELSDFLSLRSYAGEKFKSSNKIFQEERPVDNASSIERLKEEIAIAEKILHRIVTRLLKNPAHHRSFWQAKIKAHMIKICKNTNGDEATKIQLDRQTKNLISLHNEIKVPLKDEMKYVELKNIKQWLDKKLAHLYVELNEASNPLCCENFAPDFTHACMHIPEDDYPFFQLRLCSRGHEICEAFIKEHQKCEFEVRGLMSLIVELRQGQLRFYRQLFNEAFQDSLLGRYLVLLALSGGENLNESLRLSYLTQDLHNFPDAKLKELKEFILYLKDVSILEHMNLSEIAEKLTELTKFLNDPNLVQAESPRQVIVL